MKATISTDGILYFERSEGRLVKQFCPFKDLPCGDWCPLFLIFNSPPSTKIISLCKKQYPIDLDNFTDLSIKSN